MTDCPLKRWLQLQLPSHRCLDSGALSHPIERWSLIPFLLHQGRLGFALTNRVCGRDALAKLLNREFGSKTEWW